MASTTFDLPDPLGPTTTFTLLVKSMFVFSENDLKPLISKDFKYIIYPVVNLIIVKNRIICFKLKKFKKQLS